MHFFLTLKQISVIIILILLQVSYNYLFHYPNLLFPTSLVDATNKDVDVLLLLSNKAYYIA